MPGGTAIHWSHPVRCVPSRACVAMENFSWVDRFVGVPSDPTFTLVSTAVENTDKASGWLLSCVTAIRK